MEPTKKQGLKVQTGREVYRPNEEVKRSSLCGLATSPNGFLAATVEIVLNYDHLVLRQPITVSYKTDNFNTNNRVALTKTCTSV